MIKNMDFIFRITRQKRVYLTIGAVALLAIFVSTPSFTIEESAKGPEYMLAPFDEIEIKVAGEDDLSGVYKINGEGYINFSILGKVKVDELTVAQVEDTLARLLEKDYFKIKPTVFVQVNKFHKRKVVVLGEVLKPGPYEFEEDRSLSLVELITLAGGPTEKACLNATTIVREGEKGNNITLKVKAGDMIAAKEKDIILKPGDRITIPSASVIVMGEVGRAGKYDFSDANKMTLLEAISMAGGFTRIAAINWVRIIRIDESGNKETIRVRVNSIYSGKEKDVTLEPNDIIVVPESWF